ncbi:hypothetical protein [Clostridium algidicarnis]|uniref:hypothetical protein n=1 Tax=Clostridium algidicarnis TaxID=37659 RepID=UPI001C0BBE08|nr:hypothetical protein [Clostridium algidicarnis]MBU3209298.1 hypothetical protein [Clostridium algidicarnis]MBU3228013.1 hypothetical protein [Clostridium algidicarnis]MBU3251816.1 hypothetical protein [Clostridium algidicarnis]
MKYCYGCGLKVEEEDLFCINCGAKQESPKALNEEAKSVDFSGGKYVFVKMLLKPITGAKEFVQKGEKGSSIAITLFIIVMQGILGMWRANQIISGIEKTAINMTQKVIAFSNLLTLGEMGEMDAREILNIKNEINNIKRFIDMPYGKIFLQNSGIIMCLVLTVFIITYLSCSILSKNKIETFKLYKISIIIFLPILNFEILSVICSYMSFYMGIYVAIIGLIIGVIALPLILKETLDVDENHSAFISAICVIVALIIISIFSQKVIIKNMQDIITSATKMTGLFGF